WSLPAVATHCPLGLTAIPRIQPVWASIFRTGSGFSPAVGHQMRRPSYPPVTVVSPSAENAMARTQLSCPTSATGLPDVSSQRTTELSCAPVNTKRFLGSNRQEISGLACFHCDATCVFVGSALGAAAGADGVCAAGAAAAGGAACGSLMV